MSLQALIAPLAGRRCFIVYKTVKRDDGKLDKLPIHPRTQKLINAQNRRNWLTSEEAIASGLPVGLMLYEGCGYFCVDLDHALTSAGTWSQFAIDMCARFPGAAFEVSVSGTGLHIIGRCADIPNHRQQDEALGLGVYTRRRFIALTGSNLTGSIETEHTAALQAVIAQHLPPLPEDARPQEWTEEAYEGWKGGGTDEQIITMLRGKIGIKAAFGNGATFSDLFDGNTDMLAIGFPSKSASKDYDGSAADQALANHLAYGTGYNCERTLELMWMSALARPKWEKRPGYLRNTVLNAVRGRIPSPAAFEVPDPPASSSHWEIPDPPSPDAPPPPGWEVPPAPAVSVEDAAADLTVHFSVGEYMTANNQVQLFAGCCYIRDIHMAVIPDGRLLNQQQFDVHFGGYEFQMQVDGSKPTKSAWEAFTRSLCYRFPKAEGLLFDPTLPPRAEVWKCGLRFVNSWQPIEVPAHEGDVSPFLNHLAKILPNQRDREILLAYMAACVQRPGVKYRWCPVLQGVPGNGKTIISKIMAYAIGSRYCHWPMAKNLGNHFNAAFYAKLMILVEDVYIADGAPLWEAIKPMITGDDLEITPKGVDGVTREVCFNLILNMNHRNGIRKTVDDRRLAVFFTAQQHRYDLAREGMDRSYFRPLIAWLKREGFSAITHYLRTYELSDEHDPANHSEAPFTSSTPAALAVGRGIVEQEVVEALEEGKDGFRGGWVSSTALDNLLVQIGASRKISRQKRGEILEQLGYMQHPALPNGRVAEPLLDKTRPVLWITRDAHPAHAAGLTPQQVARMYLEAQAPTGA